jgi:hypothetical protein
MYPFRSDSKYESEATQTFDSSVSAAAVNKDGVIAVGLESGQIQFYQYHSESEKKLDFRLNLDTRLV